MAKQAPHNPFDFNFGRAPEVWAGRRDLLAGIASYAADKVAVPFRQVLLYGTRGSGKTALIVEWLKEAEASGWTVIDVSPERGELIGDVVEQIVEHLTSKGTFTGKLPKLSLAGLLRQVAADAKRGALFTIDEAHALSEAEFRRFGKAFQLAAARQRDRLAVVVAGLPPVFEMASSLETSTFLARLVPYHVDMLSSQEVVSALREAIVGAGGDIDDSAADFAAQQSGGWPHLLQLVGYYSLEAAGVGNRVTVEHVAAAMPQVHDLAGKQLLASAWRHVPRRVRWMLVALATHSTETIARQAFLARTGISDGLYGKLLNDAVATGFVANAGVGRVVFPLPFVRGWVASEAEREDFAVDDAADALSGDAAGDVPVGASANGDEGAVASVAGRPTYDYDLKRASADKIDALARRSKARCSHIGVRSDVRCTRPAGHAGQHRY